jgi:predicted transcriptional regulator
VRELKISKSGVGKMLQKHLDAGIIEQELGKGWRLSDPVFAHYLSRLSAA